MTLWIKKNFGSAPFDIVLQDFRQHRFSLQDNSEMMFLKSAAVGDNQIFIRLPEVEYRFLYPGFQPCPENDLPALCKLLAGSEIGYRDLLQKRAASRKTVAEQIK